MTELLKKIFLILLALSVTTTLPAASMSKKQLEEKAQSIRLTDLDKSFLKYGFKREKVITFLDRRQKEFNAGKIPALMSSASLHSAVREMSSWQKYPFFELDTRLDAKWFTYVAQLVDYMRQVAEKIELIPDSGRVNNKAYHQYRVHYFEALRRFNAAVATPAESNDKDKLKELQQLKNAVMRLNNITFVPQR